MRTALPNSACLATETNMFEAWHVGFHWEEVVTLFGRNCVIELQSFIGNNEPVWQKIDPDHDVPLLQVGVVHEVLHNVQVSQDSFPQMIDKHPLGKH